MLISCNPHSGNFWNFYYTFILQDPMVTCVKKDFFFKNLVLVLEMAVLEHFWWKHSHSLLGVNSMIGGGRRVIQDNCLL